MSGVRHVENVPPGIDTSVRLTRNERIQHIVMFSSFTMLGVTGLMIHLPQGLIRSLGIASAGFFEWRGHVHRFFAVILMAVSFYHLCYMLLTRRGRWQLIQMLPRKRDVTDLIEMFRHFRDPFRPKPRFGWYNYAEKAEYWALVWGTAVMAATGLLLWLEEFSPKIVLDVALVVHRYEAILAILAVIVWHMYHVHLAPDVFPMSPVWLTGKVPEPPPEPEDKE